MSGSSRNICKINEVCRNMCISYQKNRSNIIFLMIVQTRKIGADIEINSSIMENSTVLPLCAADVQWFIVFNLGSSCGEKKDVPELCLLWNSALQKYFLAFLHFRCKMVISQLREARGEFEDIFCTVQYAAMYKNGENKYNPGCNGKR